VERDEAPRRGRRERERWAVGPGELPESDWSCVLLVIAVVAVVSIVAIALIGAAISDGPYSCEAPCLALRL
jgi:hypothetical protein